MSRVGKLPIRIPSGVTITVDPDYVTVAGSKGTLKQFMMPGIAVTVEGDKAVVSRTSDEALLRAKHGLMRTLINNMVTGVTKGFSKDLEINGVGFRVALQGQSLKFNLGFSHDVVYKLPQGITVAIDPQTPTKFKISGIDRQQVGQVAADIRALKRPEPYKGKGIKYSDERILRKSGKSGKEK